MPRATLDYGVGIKAHDSYSSGCPLKSFKFFKTKKFNTGSSYMNTGFLNTRTPWW
ncbi:hypothetical protein Lalb_Chr09g0330501 [Lupinus albus]|uniref:Uncharacterized protein n=1 Tax=Lupinus albus TaxID=3870 RepID=A0A6A4Q0X6_LUPAL|nr:hypothetical protein Lalb_Chr09g0330501 [Lupinus albus]